MMDISTCGQIKAGFHTVNVGITYTKGAALDDDSEAIVMPDFTYGERFSRFEPFIVQAAIEQHQDESPDNDAQELPTPRPSSDMGDGADPSRAPVLARHLSTNPPGNDVHTSQQGDLDAGADPQDKADLFRLKALVCFDAPSFTVLC
jgi:hypothetical protein